MVPGLRGESTTKIYAGLCGMAAVMLLSACAAGAQGPAQSSGAGAPRQTLADLPATFMGSLPCADCPGIEYQLDLRRDHTYASRMVYEERNAHYEESGRWSLDSDGRVLTLYSKRGNAQKYAVRDAETLRQLDAKGNAIQSKLNYDLKRATIFEPLRGGGGGSTKLEGTEWKLIQIGAAPVKAGLKKAYIQLDSAGHRLSGSGGCNRLAGGYDVKGDQLKFGPIAGTRMMCAQGMETEGALMEALHQVKTWKIADGDLEFFDAGGKMLARFEPSGN